LGNQRLKERRAKAQTCKPRVAKADKDKQGILDTVSAKFVVGGQRVVDVEVEIRAWRPRCPTALADPRSIGLPHPISGRYSNTLFEIQGHGQIVVTE